MPTWITVNEGVELSGYHADHLRRLIRAGEITAVKKGNAWWVDKESLVAYIEDARESGDNRRGPK
jgi:excisionase family DNA binding protein